MLPGLSVAPLKEAAREGAGHRPPESRSGVHAHDQLRRIPVDLLADGGKHGGGIGVGDGHGGACPSSGCTITVQWDKVALVNTPPTYRECTYADCHANNVND